MLVLAIGDIIGRPGRQAVDKILPDLRQQYRLDLVIANGENAAGGFGITPDTTPSNVAGADFNGTVYPFILRNISLYGVASAETEMNLRQKIWKQLVSEWKLKFKKSFVKEVTLNSIGPEIDNILRGEICGRVVLKMI